MVGIIPGLEMGCTNVLVHLSQVKEKGEGGIEGGGSTPDIN